MGIEFGRELRVERLSHGLTQAQLAEELSDPEYIALLEAGLQEPRAEVIQGLAARLGRAPTLAISGPSSAVLQWPEYVFSRLSAQEARDLRDFSRAAEHAAAAATFAWKVRAEREWWNLSWIVAESLMKQGKLTQSLRVIQRMLGYSALSTAPELEVGAHQLYSEGCRRHGDLRMAIQHALQATELAATLKVKHQIRSQALCSLIDALADSGQVEAAWVQCSLLDSLASQTSPDTSYGEVEWAIGNVAFMRSDDEEGSKHHARALKLLPPEDVDLWARLNRSSAVARLEGGILGEDTLRTIERAELALAISGGSRTDQLETLLVRARWLCLNGQLEEAGPYLKEIHAERNLLACHLAGEAGLLFGRYLRLFGLPDRALDPLQDAQAQFVYAGVPQKVRQTQDEIAEIRQNRGHCLLKAPRRGRPS